MKKTLAAVAFALSTLAAHAEYKQVNLTVFGMDCAPYAHAIHISMKGIQGENGRCRPEHRPRFGQSCPRQ